MYNASPVANLVAKSFTNCSSAVEKNKNTLHEQQGVHNSLT